VIHPEQLVARGDVVAVLGHADRRQGGAARNVEMNR